MNFSNVTPEWIFGLAIVILGIALAYGIVRSGKRSKAEKKITDEATLRNYREEDRDA